jgi:hypothetical protein
MPTRVPKWLGPLVTYVLVELRLTKQHDLFLRRSSLEGALASSRVVLVLVVPVTKLNSVSVQSDLPPNSVLLSTSSVDMDRSERRRTLIGTTQLRLCQLQGSWEAVQDRCPCCRRPYVGTLDTVMTARASAVHVLPQHRSVLR